MKVIKYKVKHLNEEFERRYMYFSISLSYELLLPLVGSFPMILPWYREVLFIEMLDDNIFSEVIDGILSICIIRHLPYWDERGVDTVFTQQSKADFCAIDQESKTHRHHHHVLSSR